MANGAFGAGAYGVGLYGVGGGANPVTSYPSLFVDKGYNRKSRRDLYYPPARPR